MGSHQEILNCRDNVSIGYNFMKEVLKGSKPTIKSILQDILLDCGTNRGTNCCSLPIDGFLDTICPECIHIFLSSKSFKSIVVVNENSVQHLEELLDNFWAIMKDTNLDTFENVKDRLITPIDSIERKFRFYKQRERSGASFFRLPHGYTPEEVDLLVKVASKITIHDYILYDTLRTAGFSGIQSVKFSEKFRIEYHT